MIRFAATILKFKEKGEKTGWTYIEVPGKYAEQLLPGNKKSFRVKGKLDDYEISRVALIPMGEGDFIIAFNADMRKGTMKRHGDTINVSLQLDQTTYQQPEDFIECLHDEPAALNHFKTLAMSHQNYFGKWIESAKTIETRTKRISQALNALSKKMGYSEMIRYEKAKQKEW